jgi:uncharacterized repeat protein (TIGR01451 family)
VKTAPVSIVKTGDLVTYTLDLTVTTGSVNNVVVTDVLPSHMQFVGFGTAPSGAVTQWDPSTQTMTWSFPSLAPGAYQVTYQAQVDPYVTEGTVLRNCGDVSFTGGTRESCVDVAMAKIYTVHVGVYNEAG